MTAATPGDDLVRLLEGEISARRPLPVDEVAGLLRDAREHPSGPAEGRLVEHHLDIALAAAAADVPAGVDVVDLYQEGSVAVIVAVAEYARRQGDAGGLRGYVEQVVATHLHAVRTEEEDRRRGAEELVRDVGTLETASVGLRRRLGRPPTASELAGELSWDVARVELVAGILEAARDLDDEELALYLDDEEPR